MAISPQISRIIADKIFVKSLINAILQHHELFLMNRLLLSLTRDQIVKRMCCTFAFLLIVNNLPAQNIVPNGSFDEVTDIYYNAHHSGLANVVQWNGVNTVDFIKKTGSGKTNFVGLVVDHKIPAALEYTYIKLNSKLIPGKRYRLSVAILSRKKQQLISTLLLNSMDSNNISPLSLAEMARSNKHTVVSDLMSSDKRWGLKWRTFTAEFQVRNEADMIVLGNCLLSKTNIHYLYLDDVLIEEIDPEKERTIQ